MATLARVLDDICVYAVGDIQSCARLLRKIHDAICDDGKAKAASRNVVYVGDYIDRGPNSSNVIDLVLAGLRVACERVNFKRQSRSAPAVIIRRRMWSTNVAHER